MARGAAGSRPWHVDEVRLGRGLGLGFVLLAVTEFRRAIAAEQCYHHLRYNALTPPRRGRARADVPRLVFESLYSGNRA